MLKLYVGDRLLDLPENVRIRIRRSNPAYLGEDVGVIKSAFSYPFDLPLTANNRSVLGFPGRLDNAAPLPKDLRARIVAGPDTLLVGRLNCLSAGRDSTKLYFVNNPLEDLSKINMNEVDMGGYAYENLDAVLADMHDSIDNPTTRPWLTFPLLNPTGGRPAANDQFQNSYNFTTGQYRSEHPLSIFLRTERVLRLLVESVGYTWSDLFHVTEEHARICLVNNRSISNPDGPQLLTARYQDFLPETKASEFIKQYCRVFGLAPFASLSGNHLTLVPLASLTGRPPRTDWTPYAAREYQRETSPGVMKFAFPETEGFAIYTRWRDLGTPDFVVEVLVGSGPFGLSLPVGLYYETSTNRYVRSVSAPTLADPDATYLQTFGGWGSVNNFRGEEELVPNIGVVQDSKVPIADSNDFLNLPVWNAEISYETVEGTDEEPRDITQALAIYRGMDRTDDNRLYPRGGINNYDINQAKFGDDKLTLRWLGEDGLYANHWRDWDTMLKNTTVVQRTFLLPLTELLAFDFRDKVRVENRNYFVRELDFTISGQGVSATSCTMIAVS